MLSVGYLSFLLAFALAPGGQDASSGSKAVELEFDGPEGCSSGEAFFNTLRMRTDRARRAEGNEARTTLQVRLTRQRGHVMGELRMVDDRGGTETRKVQGANCDDVVQALSLTAALALDPSALLSAPATTAAASSPAGEPPPPALPAVAEKPATSVAETADTVREQRPSPTVEVSVGPVVTSLLAGGYSPGVALGAWKTVGAEGVFRPTLGVAIDYVRNDVLVSPSVVAVSLAGVTAAACPLRWSASIVTIQPCALVLAGWLSASGRDLTHTNSVDRTWLSAGGTLRTLIYLGGGLSLELDAGVSAPILPRRFYATVPSNVVAETPTISPMLGLGLTYGR